MMFPHHVDYKVKAPVWLFPCIVIALLLGACFIIGGGSAEAASSHVDVLVFNGEVNPASLRMLTRAIDTAEHDGSQALVIEIDTPGGDIDSMKSMVQAELASTVSVISYVSPAGGRAGSAGAFVALAAHIAAMAPTTRIGASSPVDSSGSNLDTTLQSKIENDLVAAMSGMQTHYGRNVPLATAMITKAASYDDITAKQQHIVDYGADDAPNLSALLNLVDGRTVVLGSGRTVTLQTAGAATQTISETAVDAFYGFLLDPNVIFLLFIVAMIGIYLEVSHPGAILPGVTGAIALLLFLFAIGSLTPNWAGLALMLLAFVLLILDVRLPTHGVLTVGAVVSLIVGALLLYSGGPYDGPQINPLLVYTMGAVIGAIGLTLVAFIVRAQRRPVSNGVEGMIGAKVIALTPLIPEGRVSYGGENWAAILEPATSVADEDSVLQVVSVEGLRLHVRPAGPQPLGEARPVSPPLE